MYPNTNIFQKNYSFLCRSIEVIVQFIIEIKRHRMVRSHLFMCFSFQSFINSICLLSISQNIDSQSSNFKISLVIIFVFFLLLVIISCFFLFLLILISFFVNIFICCCIALIVKSKSLGRLPIRISQKRCRWQFVIISLE